MKDKKELKSIFIAFWVFIVGMVFICISYMISFVDPIPWKGYKNEFSKKHGNTTEAVSNTNINMDLLTHRLIAKDRLLGTTDEVTARVAAGKVNRYLDDVNHQCKSDDTDKENAGFVACAGQLIGQHFYYTPSIEVSNNYAANRSDCDTNTYLLIDAARQRGIDPYIVYAPSHAFFAWKDSTGHFQYWETTSSNNKGKVPDLSHDLYEKNLSHSYYTPFNGMRVEEIYETLTYDIAKIKPNLSAIYKKYPDDAFISSWYYYTKAVKHKLTKDDAMALLAQLQTDITSADKRYALVHYFLSVNAHKRALNVFQTVSLKMCGEVCFQTGVELGLKRYKYFQQIFSWYSDKLKSQNAKASAGNFFGGLIFAAMGFIFITIAIVGSGILFFRHKKINSRDSD